MEILRHDDLVEIARKWLIDKRRCPLVFTELGDSVSEIPDAIGWYHTKSIVIECKTSVSDFKADSRKDHRRLGVGCERYYLTPQGILDPDAIPFGWGLLEYTGRCVKIRKQTHTRDIKLYDSLQEINLLISAIRRIGRTAPEGISCKAYYMETKNKATLSVEVRP
jgi:hypothetical protein